MPSRMDKINNLQFLKISVIIIIENETEKKCRRVAQTDEQMSSKHLDVGSSPITPIMKDDTSVQMVGFLKREIGIRFRY